MKDQCVTKLLLRAYSRCRDRGDNRGDIKFGEKQGFMLTFEGYCFENQAGELVEGVNIYCDSVLPPNAV